MQRLQLDARDPQRILCLGAHSDDIEIGCGGTLLELAARDPKPIVRWVVFSAVDERETEARDSAAAWLAGVDECQIDTFEFRESYFPSVAEGIKDAFEDLKRDFTPDLILSHHLGDRHQDHRTIAELAWNTFRDHLILEYEIPKYEGDLGHPNVYVPLERSVCERKIELLMKHFATQRGRQWFREDTFWATLRLRGIESDPGGPGFAEAFHGRKLVLGSRAG
jgi:LmbE family N-acetylglucosaminyl deacetylase